MKEITYTDLTLAARVKASLSSLGAHQIVLEDWSYRYIPLSTVRRLHRSFRDMAKKKKLKFRRNSDCDNWALWFWAHVSMYHARYEELAQSLAFGVIKFHLDARPEYGMVAQWHMANWFLDEGDNLRVWEPQLNGVEEISLSYSEANSACLVQAW